MSVNARIRQVRHALKLSQVNFSKGIHLSSGYYAGIELENRRANDRILALIAARYGVSRHWLQTGEGEMFETARDEQLERMILTFQELNADFKAFVLDFIDRLFRLQQTTTSEDGAARDEAAPPALPPQ